MHDPAVGAIATRPGPIGKARNRCAEIYLRPCNQNARSLVFKGVAARAETHFSISNLNMNS